jgi:hypothetical protein
MVVDIHRLPEEKGVQGKPRSLLRAAGKSFQVCPLTLSRWKLPILRCMAKLSRRAQPIAQSPHPAFPENQEKPLKFSSFAADKGMRGKMPSRQAHSLRA